MQIVFCGNDGIFDGLYLCILSILRRTKSKIDFYLLTGDLTNIKSSFKPLSKNHEQNLKELVAKFSKGSSFNVIDCGGLYLKKTQAHKIRMRKWTPYTLFRLLIDDLNLKGILLYLDVDILVSDDIKKAFDVDMKDYELCVCHDTPKADWNNGMYFNAGTLLINCDVAKKTKLFEKAFEYCIENNPRQLDQSALNACWTRIRFWDNEYRYNCQPDCDHTNAVINHFCGKEEKPWDGQKFLNKLWKKSCHIWDEDFAIFNESRNKNRI